MNETLTKMKQMRLLGMARAFLLTNQSQKNELFTPDEMVCHLIDSEWDERYNRKLERTIHAAHFRYKASVEQITFDENRINKNQFLRLADCDFIKQNENIIITGSTGIGKSFLASALGHQACSLGYRVIYHNNVKLFGKMKMSKADGTYLKELAKIERQHLLIIDDFGMQTLDAHSRSALMEIIEDRHGKSSTIITSQIPVNKWHEIIGDQTMADAILDRIVHNAHRIEMNGESLRKKKNSNFEGNIDLRNIKN